MNEKESLEHIEMFARNKVREGYGGIFSKRSAKKHVMKYWKYYHDKGANLDACKALGGADKATDLLSLITDRILNSKDELREVRKGKYQGSQEDLINSIWED